MAVLPGQAKHHGAEASFPPKEIPLSKLDSNARWSVTDALSRRPNYDMGTHDNENVVVIPEHMMIYALEVSGTYPPQDESILRSWVDHHRLKRIEGMWYKDGRLMVTGGLTDKQTILR